MKRLIAGSFAVAIAAAMLSATACGSVQADREAPAFDAPDATVRINAKSATEISDELFGVFLEDINYASYVMDDNLVSNGSFAYPKEGANWTAEGTELVVWREEPIAASNPEYARLSLTAGAVLENGGYAMAPMAVEKDVPCVFSAFARATTYSGDMKISIMKGEEELASETVNIAGSAWTKYRASLTPNATAAEGVTLRLTFGGSGSLDLDNVALETTDSTAGIKNYVYRAIEDLSPAFIRFPGGCGIEGKNFESAYDWKNSVGANAEDKVEELKYTQIEDGVSSERTTRGEWAARKPNTDIWQTGETAYQMDYAIGFYEYFELCDRLGAGAIPIVNCGLSCMIQNDGTGTGKELEGRHGRGVEDYIDDAIDLVAFAKGSVDSSDENERYWAQVRADMGHPAPFEMNYLGIGNEQFGSKYYEVFERFVEAFREKSAKNPLYGGIKLIVGNGTSIHSCEGFAGDGEALSAMKAYRDSGKIGKLSEYGVVDHHYYMNYVDFFNYAKLYDNYSRAEDSRYEVFVGEYSANQEYNLDRNPFGHQQNEWLAALSEAAYMTGLERNGDVVRLAAYAPMFGSAESARNQWAVDMMYYTNTRLVLTPNYYVQQAFMRNAGTHALSAETEYADGFETYYQINAGSRHYRVDKIFLSVTRDERTGDIIIKAVNSDFEDVDLNFEISGAGVKGAADVVYLAAAEGATNTAEREEVAPEYFTLGAKKKFGYTAPGYSLTVIRLHT